MKHVEIFVKFIIVDQLGAYFLLAMSKRTKISVLTLFNIIRIMRTKLLLVSLILIKLFDPGMSISTLIAFGAFLTFSYKLTKCIRVEITISLPILRIMIINAMFVLMLLGIRTWM